MTIHFYLKFHTQFGQYLSITGNLKMLGSDQPSSALKMAYFNEEFWHATITLTDKTDIDRLTYRYTLNNEDGSRIVEGEQDRDIDLYSLKVNELILLDTWNDA